MEGIEGSLLRSQHRLCGELCVSGTSVEANAAEPQASVTQRIEAGGELCGPSGPSWRLSHCKIAAPHQPGPGKGFAARLEQDAISVLKFRQTLREESEACETARRAVCQSVPLC